MSDLSQHIFSNLVGIPDVIWHRITINHMSNSKKGELFIKFKSKEKKNNDESIIKMSQINVVEILQGNLPQELKQLYICSNFSLSKYQYNLDNLSSGLEILNLSNINVQLDNLPNGLKILEINGIYDKDLNCLPSSLILLKLQSNYNRNIDNLPFGLKHLIILSSFTKPLKNLPENLVSLFFMDPDNYLVSLPKNIKYVNFNNDNDKLRKKLIKSNPKVIYNSITQDEIKELIYDELNILQKNKVDYDSDNSDDSNNSNDSIDSNNSNDSIGSNEIRDYIYNNVVNLDYPQELDDFDDMEFKIFKYLKNKN